MSIPVLRYKWTLTVICLKEGLMVMEIQGNSHPRTLAGKSLYLKKCNKVVIQTVDRNVTQGVGLFCTPQHTCKFIRILVVLLFSRRQESRPGSVGTKWNQLFQLRK